MSFLHLRVQAPFGFNASAVAVHFYRKQYNQAGEIAIVLFAGTLPHSHGEVQTHFPCRHKRRSNSFNNVELYRQGAFLYQYASRFYQLIWLQYCVYTINPFDLRFNDPCFQHAHAQKRFSNQQLLLTWLERLLAGDTFRRKLILIAGAADKFSVFRNKPLPSQ